MNSYTAFIVLALLAGVAVPLQIGLNARLGRALGQPTLAALVSFGVGTTALLLYTAAQRATLPGADAAAQTPWWAWAGGAVGAFYVTSAIIAAPRLGAATLLGLIVAGQTVASLVFDHYGLLGYAVQPVNVWRVVGAALLVAGVIIVQRN